MEIDWASSQSRGAQHVCCADVNSQSLPSQLLNYSGLAWQINLTFAKHIDAGRDPMFEQFINRIRLE